MYCEVPMTIKLKIALYNIILVSVIVLLMLFFMSTMSDSIIEQNVKNQLLFLIEENADEVEYDDGKLELDDLTFYLDHITTLVYSETGYYMAGQIEQIDIFSTYPLKDQEFTKVTVDGEDFILYDFFVDHRKHEGVYLRGIASVAEISAPIERLFLVTMIFLPLFILLSGAGSYYIGRKAMEPMEKIMGIAEEISHGDDLSSRINLGQGKDEVSQLAQTFDEMFSQLEQAFLAEKQFSSDVSHELRTPIAVILAECELHLTSTSSETEQREALEVIQRQGFKMQKLISTLLHLIRIDNGVEKMQGVEIDFSELVEIVCEEQESLLQQGKELRTEIQRGIFLELDDSMMIRVLSNLIDNGFKYGKEDGFVKVSLREQGAAVILTVEDDGIGLIQEDLDKIFHRFYQVAKSRTVENGSMGLGLSMVEQMVKLQGGTIQVESELGVGSRFILNFKKNEIMIFFNLDLT